MLSGGTTYQGKGYYENVSGTLKTQAHGVFCLNDQGGSVMGVTEDVTGTLRAQEHGHQPCVVYNEETVTSKANASNPQAGDPCHTLGATGAGRTICIQGNVVDRDANCNGKGWRDDDLSYTQNTVDRHGVYAIDNHPQDSCVTIREDGVVQTLSKQCGTGGGNVPMCIGNGQADNTRLTDKADTLNCMHDQQAVLSNQTVRRLTPLECERLQGFPDRWTDIGEWVDSKGKKHISSDSARYKALGNSIALPPWRYVLGKLIRYCEEKTMASLFDGIGGFPLIWGELGGETLWASEIEEFPIAVTKRRFGSE